MEKNRLIQKIKLRNILSFGENGEEIDLQPLNVLIGPNASGKSNLIEIIKLLRDGTSGQFLNTIVSGGGIDEYLWKGNLQIPIAEIFSILAIQNESPVSYELSFTKSGQQIQIVKEEILDIQRDDERFFYYRNKGGVSEIVSFGGENVWIDDKDTWGKSATLEKSRFDWQRPILSQIKDPTNYPLISELVNNLEAIEVFKDLFFSRNHPPRQPVQANTPGDFLSQNLENLVIVINDMQSRYFDAYREIVERLKKVYGRTQRLITHLQHGTIQLYIEEQGLESRVSATRLSDGTLRYLCLLAILCHPEPPPLICIEEPETGLHPDILPTIAELLVGASTRTQLIVTTHSDILVSALSETPEAVLVCEKDDDGTHFKRLEADKLKTWLEDYSLGDLWLKGEIGGTRW